MRGIRWGLGAAQTLSIAQLVISAAQTYGVSPELAVAVATRESNLNPNAVNPSSGAAGVMQLMPATAASLGVTNIMDPVQNVNAGVKYLAGLVSTYGGDSAKAVAAYDWGPGNLNKAIAQYGDNWLAYAPVETQNYVAAITGETPNAPADAQTAGNVVTIDANTGEPVTDAADVSTMPTIDDSGAISAPGAAAPPYLTYAAVGIGLWLLYDVLS